MTINAPVAENFDILLGQLAPPPRGLPPPLENGLKPNRGLVSNPTDRGTGLKPNRSPKSGHRLGLRPVLGPNPTGPEFGDRLGLVPVLGWVWYLVGPPNRTEPRNGWLGFLLESQPPIRLVAGS